MNSSKQLPSGHVLGVYGHFPEDSVSCFDDKDNFHVLPDDDSLITVDDFFMLTLENENNTVLERIEGNPIKSKERGSGTVTSAMLLELGLVLGSDSRITREDNRIGADKLKLQTIRVHPPTFGVWCGEYEAANRFLQSLKSMVKLGKSIEFLVKRGEAFLNRHDDMDAFAVYVCYMEDQVPAGYIFY